MKLKDEKGNEFEFSDLQTLGAPLVDIKTRTYGYLIPTNPMPELEEGDWVKMENSRYAYFYDAYGADYFRSNKGLIVEIRKADRTVWKR